MLLQPGKPRHDTGDVVAALAQCHDRIRATVALARTLAGSPDAAAAEIAEAAMRIRRYFTEALPRHVADEDDTIAPMLAGSDPAVDAALAELAAQHHRHDPVIAELIAVATAIEADPSQLSAHAAELARIAGALAVEFAAHLALEEQVIHPAIRALPAADQDRIRAAMAARRAD
jgi:iron-sulfur cluster repair protein YtfE (RIC family)